MRAPKKFLLNSFTDRLVENIAYLNGYYIPHSACHQRNDPGNFGKSFRTPVAGYAFLRSAVRKAIQQNYTFKQLTLDLCLGRGMKGGEQAFVDKFLKRLGTHLYYKFHEDDKFHDYILEYTPIERDNATGRLIQAV